MRLDDFSEHGGKDCSCCCCLNVLLVLKCSSWYLPTKHHAHEFDFVIDPEML